MNQQRQQMNNIMMNSWQHFLFTQDLFNTLNGQIDRQMRLFAPSFAAPVIVIYKDNNDTNAKPATSKPDKKQ
jgi:hypothetical protein